MRTRSLVISLLVGLLFVANAEGANKRLWVYWPTWGMSIMTPRDAKFYNGIDIVYIHFSAHISTTAPYFSVVTDPVSSNSDSAQLHYRQQELIDTCHNNGQQVILSITAQDNNLGNIAANATQRHALQSSVAAYLVRKGYDGIDWDWEANLNASVIATFIREMRDTLTAHGIPIQVMATLPDPWQYSAWNFYDMTALNTYLDAYFSMNYGYSITAYDESTSYTNHRCMFDCPTTRPVGAPWNTGAGYIYGTFDHNGPARYISHGADTNVYGTGFWNGGTPMLNSSSSSVPGSSISYPTASFYSYPTILNSGSSNYVAEVDHQWGIVGGRYTSWITPSQLYRRMLSSLALGSDDFMLYDGYSGFIDLAARYGLQPHLDSMAQAIYDFGTTPASPTITITATSLPAFATTTPNISSAQTYNVSGADLTANIVVTSPNADFQVSTSIGSGYGSSLTLTQSGGSVASTPVYVKFVKTTAGSNSGNITHTSTGAATRLTAVSGTATNPTTPSVIRLRVRRI